MTADRGRARRATSRRGCCRTTARARTTRCAATCAASTTTTRSTSSIVGCGAGGSVLAQRLARRGWKVVALDAGPFWDPDRDWVSDERGSHHLYWTEPRVIAGDDPVALGCEQLRARRRRLDGALRRLRAPVPSVGLPHRARSTASAPTGRSPTTDLRPYYEQIEHELPVAGEPWPWGDPHRYPHSPHPVGGNGLRVPARLSRRGHRRAGRAGRDHQRPLRATGRTASTEASACRAARSTPRRRRSSPTSPTRSRTAPRSAPTAW